MLRPACLPLRIERYETATGRGSAGVGGVAGDGVLLGVVSLGVVLPVVLVGWIGVGILAVILGADGVVGLVVFFWIETILASETPNCSFPPMSYHES